MKKIFYLSIAFIGFLICPNSNVIAQGGVGINSSGNAADPSAGIDVNYNNKGVLLPRMNTAAMNSIGSPANGLTIFNTDCGVYYYNAGSAGSPNWVAIPGSNSVVAGVSISSVPAGSSICNSSSVTFTAVPANGINSANYQWVVNGNNVGSNSSTYTYTPSNNDAVYCVLTTSQGCASGSPATSNTINVVVNATPSTPGTISVSAVMCQDSNAVFSISPVPGTTSYNWIVPPHATIISGQGSTSVKIGFDGTLGNVGHVSVSAGNDCGISASDTANITINPYAPATPGVPSGIIYGFDDSSYTYTISSVPTATTYFWSAPSFASITAGGVGDTFATVAFTTNSGKVYVRSGNSCGVSAPDSTYVTLCSINHGSVQFNYSGGVQTFTVPCTTALTISAYGGAGGNSGCCNYGYGGLTTGTLAVTPQQLIYVYCGGQGSYANCCYFNGGGWNGGGNAYQYGYGGGGETDIRVGGQGYNNVVLVAAGGGGTSSNTGNNGVTGLGGGGGGLTGGTGTNDQEYYNGNYGVMYTYGGSGGSSGGGGSGGSYYNDGASCGYTGATGTQGQGGNSPTEPYSCGGGGGYYGGGGGGYNCYNGYGGPGGGGSAYYSGAGITNGSTVGDQNSGNGYVVITW